MLKAFQYPIDFDCVYEYENTTVSYIRRVFSRVAELTDSATFRLLGSDFTLLGNYMQQSKVSPSRLHRRSEYNAV